MGSARDPLGYGWAIALQDECGKWYVPWAGADWDLPAYSYRTRRDALLALCGWLRPGLPSRAVPRPTSRHQLHPDRMLAKD